jgi:hypothetical protein
LCGSWEAVNPKQEEVIKWIRVQEYSHRNIASIVEAAG